MIKLAVIFNYVDLNSVVKRPLLTEYSRFRLFPFIDTIKLCGINLVVTVCCHVDCDEDVANYRSERLLNITEMTSWEATEYLRDQREAECPWC